MQASCNPLHINNRPVKEMHSSLSQSGSKAMHSAMNLKKKMSMQRWLSGIDLKKGSPLQKSMVQR